MALGFTRDDLAVCFQDKYRLTFEQFLHVIDGKTTGALRASIGLATNFADVSNIGSLPKPSSIEFEKHL